MLRLDFTDQHYALGYGAVFSLTPARIARSGLSMSPLPQLVDSDAKMSISVAVV